MVQNFSAAISVSPRVCFILVLVFNIYVSELLLLKARNLPRKPNNVVKEPRQNKGSRLVDRKQVDDRSPHTHTHSHTNRLFCVDSLAVLDMVYGYVLFFLLIIKMENRKKINVLSETNW